MQKALSPRASLFPQHWGGPEGAKNSCKGWEVSLEAFWGGEKSRISLPSLHPGILDCCFYWDLPAALPPCGHP